MSRHGGTKFKLVSYQGNNNASATRDGARVYIMSEGGHTLYDHTFPTGSEAAAFFGSLTPAGIKTANPFPSTGYAAYA